MPDETPLVSVGIPVYNRAHLLKQAIESVRAQDYAHLEIVISDNASTDETEAVCRDYAQRDARICYIRQEANRGPRENFIEVYLQSTGEYFMWLGDDDWIDPNYISRCVATLQDNPDCSLVCGWAQYIQDEQFAYDGVVTNLVQNSDSQRVLVYYRTVVDNGPFYGVMRRRLSEEIPLPLNVFGGDWIFVASIAFIGKIKTLSDTRVYRRLQGSSASTEKMVSVQGLKGFQSRYPYTSLAVGAMRDVWSSRAYRRAWPHARLLLGIRVFFIILNRHVVPHTILPWSVRILQRVFPRRLYEMVRAWHRKRKAGKG